MMADSGVRKWIALSFAVVMVLLAGVLAGIHYWGKPTPPPSPVSVLVADFNNATSDPVFNGTLEPAFTVALEGATFITAYDREAAHRTAAQLQPGEGKMDEKVAQLVAQRQGVGVVVAGSIASEGGSYRLSTRAIDAFTGKLITAQELDGIKKDGVLLAAAKLAARVRIALRDDTPESLQLAAAETFTAASVEAAHTYAVARQLEGQGKSEEAIHSYLQAVELDPNLGRAYANLAAIYINLGQPELADKYQKLAVARIDRMSDREKYKTRGIYYLGARNNVDKAVEELSALVKQYPADNAGLKNLALAYFYERDLPKALEVGRHALQLYPKNVTGRGNVALYAMYASDFEGALQEARATLDLNPNFERAQVATALSDLALGRVAEAEEFYSRLEKTGALGASFAGSGLADLALYQGRDSDAVAILEKGIAQDRENKQQMGAAIKSAVLASARFAHKQTAPALKAADDALSWSKEDSVVVTVARAYAEAGLDAKAIALASQLEASTAADPQAYGKIIEGEIQLRKNKPREALKFFEEARKLADTWLGRFDLGRAYLEADQPTEAYSELDLTMKRRGEAAALFLDEYPSYHYFPPVYYYLARSQEALKSPAAADSYRAFLSIKEKGGDDPLIADARRRSAGQH
jgi:Flp pilus assembly protein TadD